MEAVNGSWEKKREEVNRLKAEQALQVLARDIAHIRYVKDWAHKSGYTQNILNELVKRYFRSNSKQLLKEVRYNKICRLIEDDPNITSYAVACSCGLSDEQGLFKFLKRHFDTTYSEIRYEVLLKHLKTINSETEVDSSIKKWLQ
jgi:AraC-like DNA-binding protein